MAVAPTKTDAASTDAPAKRKRAPFTRTEKPIYVVVDYVGDDGQPIKLDKSRLTLTLERDADKILERSENSNGNSTFVRVQMPKAEKKEAPAAPAADAATA